MQIVVIKHDKLYKYPFPSENVDSYWIKDRDEAGNERELISIEKDGDSWFLLSNSTCYLEIAGAKVEKLSLSLNSFYPLKIRDNNDNYSSGLLYIYKENDESYRTYKVVKPGDYTIGKGDNQNIIINNEYINDAHAVIRKTEEGFFVKAVDTKNGIYVNDGIHELAYTTKATAYTWDMYRFPWIVAGKYCIWWVPWNETTMIVVPILASLWVTVPKSFSKAITSPAATGECVNVLMDIEFDKQEVIRITDKVWACLVRNEKLNLAPVNDRIIKVSSPLWMEPYARMISSIMAKNYAMWINHCLIDIPMWPTAKVATARDAKRVAKRFKEIWEYLWIKMDVQITDGSQPIGRWIWACLQAREALRILQQFKTRSKDLEEKSIFLASRILLLCWVAETIENAENLAKTQLKNWEAWKKMQEIIKAQNWNPNIKSEDVELWKFSFDVVATKNCVINKVDMRLLNTMVRWLWAPKEYKAWIYLHKKLWDKVKKWEVIYTMYSPSANKLNLVKEMQQKKDFYTYK